MWKPFRKVKFEYIKILRMKGAPSFVALGFAVGMLIEFITLPTLGLAFILIYPLNKILGSSLSASLVGFFIGKITLPFFMLANLSLGNKIIGKSVSTTNEPPEGLLSLWEWLKVNGLAYLTGSFFMGILVSIASYGIIYYCLYMYRKKRARSRTRPSSVMQKS